MTQDTEYLKSALTGYLANVDTSKHKDVISAGRAVGLAMELNLPSMAQVVWRKSVPAVAGMPTIDEFRAGYEAHLNSFNAFATGEKGRANFTAPGTRFSNAMGCYARALHHAAYAKQPVGDDSPEYWAAHWGSQALLSAGFSTDVALRLSDAILKGNKLETVPTKSPRM